MLKAKKSKVLFLHGKLMDQASPIVIDGVDHTGPFGERVGRIYTLSLSDGSIRKAYLTWDSGDIDYFFSAFVQKGFENAPDPENHRSAEKAPDLSKILEAFDRETLFGTKRSARLLALSAKRLPTKKAALG